VSRALERVAGVQRRVPFGVALTFDDVTSAAIDALAALDARATFFLGDDVGESLVRDLRAAGHGVGWRTESARDALTLLDGRVPRLHRPATLPRSFVAAVRFRRRRLDAWLWSIDDAQLDEVRDRDVVRVTDDVEGAVAAVRARGLEFVALCGLGANHRGSSD
jgi:peptidoglycan/xylan/chitin deacetylase (PgdA/CDA1 family)